MDKFDGIRSIIASEGRQPRLRASWTPPFDDSIVVNVDVTVGLERAIEALVARDSASSRIFMASKLFGPLKAKMLEIKTLH